MHAGALAVLWISVISLAWTMLLLWPGRCDDSVLWILCLPMLVSRAYLIYVWYLVTWNEVVTAHTCAVGGARLLPSLSLLLPAADLTGGSPPRGSNCRRPAALAAGLAAAVAGSECLQLSWAVGGPGLLAARRLRREPEPFEAELDEDEFEADEFEVTGQSREGGGGSCFAAGSTLEKAKESWQVVYALLAQYTS
jgi:hypothetical protein